MQKRFSEAYGLAQKLMADYPNSYHVNIYYVRILKELNRLPEAEETIRRLLQFYPDNLNILNETADICFKSQKYSDALEFYNKILFLDPFNVVARETIDKIKARQKTVDESVLGGIDEETTPEIPLTDFGVDIDLDLEKEMPPPPKPLPPSPPSPQLVQTSPPPPLPPMPPMPPEPEIKPEFVPEFEPLSGQEVEPDWEPESEPEIEDEVPEIQEDEEGEPEFVTESAANLYLSQGLYKDALQIYQQLNDRQPEERFILKIKQLKAHILSQEQIRYLGRFLESIKIKGEQRV